MLDFSKIFENKNRSVFDNMDDVMKMITEAEQQPEPEEGEGEEAAPQEDPTTPEPTAPNEADPNAEPADEESGVYVSSNEKATIAKTMLDALQADPPKPGEVPENLLNVTNANADEVIKYIQSLISLTNSVSLSDNGNDNGLVDTLKQSWWLRLCELLGKLK